MTATPPTPTESASGTAPKAGAMMFVAVTAAGAVGRFVLPDEHFDELLAWLAERAGRKESRRQNP